MSHKQLTATSLRVILSVMLFLIVAIGATGFYFANTKLQTVATEVSHTVVDADASRNNLQSLQLIEKELAKQKDVIERTNSIVADSQSYQYQNQIIADLNDYAKRAGIRITSLDFSAAGAASAPSTPAATTPATSATATPVAPAGVKSTSVSVTLSNPVDYKSLLTFIKLIEQNLTKMQVSKIGLSKDASTGKLTSDVLTIEVYIR